MNRSLARRLGDRRAAVQACTLAAAFTVFATSPAVGQEPATDQAAAHTDADPAELSVERIFMTSDFRSERFGPARWLEEGDAYTTVERSEETDGGRDIVRYDTQTGERTTLIPAAMLIPEGAEEPLAINNYTWSPDDRMMLLFTNSKRVWRRNTKGDYWVLDLDSGSLRQLGPEFESSTLMFAKFSPQSDRVAYVQAHDIYVEDLESGEITRLTEDGSETIINGTFDWVYEEEFGLRDGFRWSPDGERIAFWQLDAEGIGVFLMIDNTDSLYSYTIPVQYPKAGEMNSAARVGAVSAHGGDITWFDVPGDQRDNYIARMEWAGNSDDVMIQRMNRLQNTNQVMLGDAATGSMHTIHTETDEAWLDRVTTWTWLGGDESLVWTSEETGWRHLYALSRDGADMRAITSGEWDVSGVSLLDEDGGWVYFIASPDNPTQRFLYRARLDGSGAPERLTPEDVPGWHSYNLSPNAKWALHTWSSFGVPSTTELISLPNHETVRTLVSNDDLKATVAALDRGETSFFRVPIGDIDLDGWMMKPPDFDPSKRYPILFFGYSGPAAQTVTDRWGGNRYLWHLMLTQQGYIVASVDNRGTPSPRGREFRKAIYGKDGQVNIADLAAAATEIVSRPFIDETRVGTWGWSGGGSMALNLLFQYPDLYQTAVAVAPVTNQKFYDTIYTERYMGLPQDNAEGYRLGDPATYVDQLRGNLLLIHGTGDDNVHFQNSEVLINAMIGANKPFTMMAYPGRSHGIFEGEGTTLHLYNLITRYLNDNLPAGGRDATS